MGLEPCTASERCWSGPCSADFAFYESIYSASTSAAKHPSNQPASAGPFLADQLQSNPTVAITRWCKLAMALQHDAHIAARESRLPSSARAQQWHSGPSRAERWTALPRRLQELFASCRCSKKKIFLRMILSNSGICRFQPGEGTSLAIQPVSYHVSARPDVLPLQDDL